MADIIIRGMEMPKSCDECRLFNECWCMALGIDDWRKSYNKPPEGERLPDCPLVPLPAGHGRLIDADALGDFPYNISFCDEGDVENWIASAPAIVPAEGGGEDGE